MLRGWQKSRGCQDCCQPGSAAAISITTKLLFSGGFSDVTLCDRKGAIYEGRREGMNPIKEEMAKLQIKRKAEPFADMLKGADVFIGVSARAV